MNRTIKNILHVVYLLSKQAFIKMESPKSCSSQQQTKYNNKEAIIICSSVVPTYYTQYIE